MKRFWCLCLSVVFVFAMVSFALAENANATVFAFENPTYSVFAGKTIKVNPVKQGINGTLKFTWTSADETIATVNNGTVKGVTEGQTTIHCDAATKDGTAYSAEYMVVVTVPIQSIKAAVSTVTLAPSDFWGESGNPEYETFTPNLTILPENATNKQLEWTSSDSFVASVNKNGVITSSSHAGTAKITGKATDGSGKTVTITVKVPKTFVSLTKHTFDTAEPVTFYQAQASQNGFNTYATKRSGDAVTYTIESSDSGDLYKVFPVKAGKSTISFIHNGKKEATVTFTVNHSAVYDKVSYPPMTVANIIAKADASIGKKTQFTGVVEKIESIEEGNVNQIVTLSFNEKNEKKYAMIEYDRAGSLNMGETYTMFGEISKVTEYESETGLKYACPYLVNGHIN